MKKYIYTEIKGIPIKTYHDQWYQENMSPIKKLKERRMEAELAVENKIKESLKNVFTWDEPDIMFKFE